MSANLNSLTSKRLSLDAAVAEHRPQIICLQESKLDGSIRSEDVAMEGFKMFRLDRTRNGGGLATYIHSSFTASVVGKTAPGLEALSVRVVGRQGRSLLVTNSYRSPSAGVAPADWFIEHLDSHLASLPLDSACRVFVGDTNLDHLADESAGLRDVLTEHELRLADPLQRPTHGSKLIDYVAVSPDIQSFALFLAPTLEKSAGGHAALVFSAICPHLPRPETKMEAPRAR